MFKFSKVIITSHELKKKLLGGPRNEKEGNNRMYKNGRIEKPVTLIGGKREIQ